MARRGITEQDVDSALRRRQGAPGPGQPGTMWVSGFASGGKILKVCVRSTDQNHVITAAWPD
jgi:hypothetical protein